MRDGTVSSRELVELCLERIARFDPALNAFRVVFAERALAESERLGEGALRGVPVAVKDDVDVAGELTTHGTGAVRRPATADAEVVRRLRTAGAIVIGKTNLPELALWGAFTESATWGRTANPWDTTRSPGGSSGGSAAAVAAGLVPAALGSDGGASVRVPAACCGLFGLKPERGRIPTAPRPEPWHGLMMYGPLTRTVLDAALLLDACGDGGGFAEAARRDPGRLRVAVSLRTQVPLARVSGEVRDAVAQTAELLRELGHEVAERDPDYGILGPLAIPRYLRAAHDDAALLDRPDLLERRTRRLARAGGLIPDRALAAVRAREAGAARRINAVFADHDVLLTPTTTSAPPPLGRWEGRGAARTFMETSRFFATTPAWNLTGQPAASVPAGFDADGVPLGVQLVARPRDEATLLSLAAQLERARPWAGLRPQLVREVG